MPPQPDAAPPQRASQTQAAALAAVSRIASLLAGRTKLQEILDTATRQVAETMGLRAASLRLLDEATGEMRVASVAHLSPRYLAKGPLNLRRSKIDQQALSGQTVYVRDMRTDPRTVYKQEAKKEGLVSALITGLSCGGQKIGAFRAYWGEERGVSPEEVALLETISSQVAAAIVNARLREEAVENEHLEAQIRMAGAVQRRMIPAQAPRHPAYDFGCVYEPTSTLGGDFFDFLSMANGDMGVVIADVVGKGVPASLMMASARAIVRSHAKRVPGPAELMSEVNLRLVYDTLPGEFVTSLYAVLAADGRSMSYCNAGHEPLLLVRGNEVRSLDAGGLVLGLDPRTEYESGECELKPGDVLVWLTDGVLDARNYEGQAFGRDRLIASVKLHGGMSPDMPAQLIAKQLLWDVRRFAGLVPQVDDLTIVVARVRSAVPRPLGESHGSG